jgi:hypothetical protein
MAVSRQYIVSFVAGAVASVALFAVLYSGFRSSEGVPTDGQPLQVVSAASRTEDTGGRIGSLESEFDMGTISNDKVDVKTLAIKNTGNGKLSILDVKTSCGCTKGYFKDGKREVKTASIAPGESAELFISVDPFRVPGFSSSKTLTLFTNDPGNATLSFDVLAAVQPEFEVDPEQLHLGVISKGEKVAGQAIVRQLDDSDFDVTAARPGARANETYTAALAPRPESEWRTPGKREWTLDVELDTSSLRKGLFRDRIYIETNCERLKVYGYMLNVDVQTFYSVIPELLHRRDAVDPGTVNIASAVVSADQPITINGMSISDPAVTVTIKQDDSPNTAVLELSVAEDASPGVKNATLSFTVVSEDGNQAEHSLRAIVAVNQSK